MRIRHRKHISNVFLELEQRLQFCVSCADDPPLQRIQLRQALRYIQRDVLPDTSVDDQLALIAQDRDAFAYLASLPRDWNTPNKRLLRPSRADLIDLFERRLAHIDACDRAMPGHAKQPFVKVEANAWRDYITRLQTDWYDALPDVLETNR